MVWALGYQDAPRQACKECKSTVNLIFLLLVAFNKHNFPQTWDCLELTAQARWTETEAALIVARKLQIKSCRDLTFSGMSRKYGICFD